MLQVLALYEAEPMWVGMIAARELLDLSALWTSSMSSPADGAPPPC